ncbi:unnamed protein product, partial [Prunus brigantina]
IYRFRRFHFKSQSKSKGPLTVLGLRTSFLSRHRHCPICPIFAQCPDFDSSDFTLLQFSVLLKCLNLSLRYSPN